MRKIIRCANCGWENAEDAKFCSSCGKPIEDEPIEPEYVYDFGEEPSNETNPVFPQPFPQTFPQQFAQPIESVPTTIAPEKANKYKRNIVSWAAFILVASVIGFIYNLTSLEDAIDIQNGLASLPEEYYGIFKAIADDYFACIVMLVLLIVAAVVYVVFSVKLNKFNFPVQDDKVFGVAKLTLYAAIATTVLELVLFIVELFSFIHEIQFEMMFEDVDSNLAVSAGFMLKDLVFLGISIAMTVFTLKLAKCKKSDTI